MAAKPPRTLFESATSRGRLIRQGDLACMVMDGGGAVVVNSQDLVMAQKWAQSRPPSGNLLTDRGRFLDQIPVLISRPGSQQSTRGNDRQIERLARAMKQAGYDLSEWQLPPEMKTPAYWMPAAPERPEKKDAPETP